MIAKFVILTIASIISPSTCFCNNGNQQGFITIDSWSSPSYDCKEWDRRIKARMLPQANKINYSVNSSRLRVATRSPPETIEKTATDFNNELSVLSESARDELESNWKADNFVFGLDGSGLSRPKGKVAQVVVEGDDLETKPYQVGMVTATISMHILLSLSCLHQIVTNHGIIGGSVQSLLITIMSIIIADLGSGILHWSVDNYGNGRTPIFGSIIAAFQGHHSAPWTITQRGFCNNVHKLCIPFGIPTILAINTLFQSSSVTLFFAVFCVAEIMSQEFHKWSHMTKSEVPVWVNWFQDLGVTIGRKSHALHHIAPYDGNYCIVNGICNDVLDKSGIFRRFEHWIFRMNGVESNAWKLNKDLRERTLAGDYSP